MRKRRVEGDRTVYGYRRISHLGSVLALVKLIADRERVARGARQVRTAQNVSQYGPWGNLPADRRVSDAERLFERQEKYPERIVPRGGLFLTAGVDVQADRIEVHVRAWGRGKQSWLVDYFALLGRPYEGSVWNALTGALDNTYEHACGVSMPIVRMAIDTGHATNEVYKWVRSQGAGRVMAIKGTGSTEGAIVGSPSPVDVSVAGKKIKRGAKVWPVAVSPLKFELYGWLALSRNADDGSYPDGYFHVSSQSLEWFKQLTAEQWQVQNVKGKGYRKGEWVKVRERNEVLDTAIYARAAASQVGMDRWDERTWKALESNFGQAEESDDIEVEVEEMVEFSTRRLSLRSR